MSFFIAQKIILIGILCFCNMCCNRIVKPTEPKIIKAIEPNNSSLINAELVYIPTNPKINANTFMVVGIEKLGFFDLVGHTGRGGSICRLPSVIRSDHLCYFLMKND